jgi:hypothetical protein
MDSAALRCEMNWAEDRAPQRCDPSADPGAKTEARAASLPASPALLRFGIGAKALNLRGTKPRNPWQDALHISLTLDGCHSSSRRTKTNAIASGRLTIMHNTCRSAGK